MQKNGLKASILIWAIFISLIITATFIQISTKINKNLKNNNSISEQLKINNSIQNIVNSGSIDGNFMNQILENGDEIIFSKSNELITSLKESESHLSKINSSGDITIEILDGGPITYVNNLNDGIIDNNITFSATIGDLILKNLGGYTTFKISSIESDNYLSQYTTYEVSKKIGNKKIIKSKGKIKNF